jgi:hypothetical protein
MIIGKRVIVKSRDWYDANQVKGVVVPAGEYYPVFYESLAEHCGKVFTLHNISDDEAILRNDKRYERFPLFALEEDPTDTRVITKEHEGLVDDFINKMKFVMFSDCGEVHGSSKKIRMDKTSLIPCFVDGTTGFILDPSGYRERITLGNMKKLVDERKLDVSFYTGASFIRREIHVYENEVELKKNEFEY